MGVLNYTNDFEHKGKPFIGIASTKNGETNLDFYKLIFAQEANTGHLIHRGIDYLADYVTTSGIRGMVPSVDSSKVGTDLSKIYFRGDGWAKYWSASDEAAAGSDKDTYLANTLMSAKDVKQLILDGFAANDALVFKGIVDPTLTSDDATNHKYKSTPTNATVGETYKINGGGQVHGKPVEAGDMLICVKDVDASLTDDNFYEYWAIVQDNVEHLVTHSVNGVNYTVYTSGTEEFGIYAPISAGQGAADTSKDQQVLVATGATPEWKTAKETITALRTVQAISVFGGGLLLNDSDSGAFDGSVASVLKLAPATVDYLGAVIADRGNHQADGAAELVTSGNKQTITIGNDGEIYLTHENIINALGFDPGNTTQNAKGMVFTNAANSSSNSVVALADAQNIFLNLVAADDSVLGSVSFKKGEGIAALTTADGAMSYVLEEATSSTYGGVRIWKKNSAYSVTPFDLMPTISSNVNEASTIDAHYYGVNLDKDGRAYVYVNWIDGIFADEAKYVYSVESGQFSDATAPGRDKGLVPALSAATIASNDHKASSTTFLLGSDAKWYQLPLDAFGGSWRPIQVNGTELASAVATNEAKQVTGLTLNLKTTGSAGHVTLTPSTTADNVAEIDINATWREITVNGTQMHSGAVDDGAALEFSDFETVVIRQAVDSQTGKKSIVAGLRWFNLDSNAYEAVIL